MSDIDRVFARMGGRHSAASDQRELRSIPRKGGSTGARVVEVVRLPSRGAVAAGSPRRSDSNVRAQTWDNGFPARAMALSGPQPQPMKAEAPEPVGHVMLRQSAPVAPEPAQAPVQGQAGDIQHPPKPPSIDKQTRPRRGVADPFDAADDGANCLRCGYVIEPARVRRGLMTCGECG